MFQVHGVVVRLLLRSPQSYLTNTADELNYSLELLKLSSISGFAHRAITKRDDNVSRYWTIVIINFVLCMSSLKKEQCRASLVNKGFITSQAAQTFVIYIRDSIALRFEPF